MKLCENRIRLKWGDAYGSLCSRRAKFYVSFPTDNKYMCKQHLEKAQRGLLNHPNCPKIIEEVCHNE